jgi:hypothetical protein
MRNLLALLILVISFSAISADPGSVRPANSKITASEAFGICAAWNVQERDIIEDDLDQNGLDIAIAYFDIECSQANFPLREYPLFLRVYMDLSYKTDVKWLMRKFKKSPRADKNELLTCALNHTSYQNQTIIEGMQWNLKVGENLLRDAQTQDDIDFAEWKIKEAKNIIAYMKKHTDKYPVAKPLEFCPLLPGISAKTKP